MIDVHAVWALKKCGMTQEKIASQLDTSVSIVNLVLELRKVTVLTYKDIERIVEFKREELVN